jgi:hypothetical protein
VKWQYKKIELIGDAWLEKKIQNNVSQIIPNFYLKTIYSL